MKVVILLTLLGACLGLHPNLEFQYRYSARVASGIPSINNNFAGAGIQADLTIQITSSYDIFFKLSNIEVGEYHDEIECDTQAPLPIEYRPLVEGKELLEKPFQVHPGQQKGEEYIVTPIEPAWITNIRKALTRAFGIPPLLANIGRRIDSFKLPAYSVNETLIHGECTTWYSVIRLNEEEAAREDHEREEDIQRDQQESDSYTSSKGPLKTSKTHTSKTTKTAGTKTTGTKTTGTKTTGTKGAPAKLTSPDRIANTLWRLTRTVAFDTCEDLVKWKIHGNKKIDKKIQRSSIGTYLIRGNERSARIEYAVIEGSISLFTSKQEHVSTFTNLTLELKAVRSIRNLFTINYEIEKHESFVYEVDTFSVSEQEPGHDVHPSLEQLVTGIPITSQGVTEIKVLIIKLLKVLVKRPTTFPYSKDPLVKDLSILVDAVSILSKPEIQALTSQIEREELPAEKLQIFYEVLVTAGTEPAIRYLLDKIKDPEFRKANKALTNTFVENFHLSVKSPLVIPDIIVLEQALSWTEDDQEFKISVLLNLASLAKQLCISSEKWETFGYNTCDPEYTCTPDSIIENFLPSLVQGIQDDESPLWVKLVYIQALANLGLPQTIDVLKHFVVGDKPSTSIQVLRTTAIFGISGIYLPKTAKSTVFSLLIPVFENTAEHFEVRNVAFLAMMTYEPSLAWWERIAISTWRDPSSQVASFVSSTFTSLANSNYPLSKIASRVVHLVKPAPHVSLTHSAMVYLNDYLYNCKSQHFLSFGWFASTKGLFPSKIILRLQFKTFLGFATEFKSTFGQEEINKIIKKAYITFVMSKAKTTKSSDAETVQEMFDEIVDQLGLIHTEKPSDSSFYLLLTDYISLVPPVLDSPENILTALTQEDIGLSTPHIDREVDYSEVFPTDLGLPFTIHFAEEVAYWFDWKVTETQSIPTKRKDLVNVIFDVSLESTLEVKTLLPWSTKFGVGAGLHNVASFIFPLSVHTKIDNERTEVKVTIEPQDGSQVQLFNSHNYPFTVVTGPFPTAVHTQQAEYKKITAFPLETLVHKHQVLPAIAGLSVETHWTADFVFQPDLATFLSDDFDPLIPAYKAWDYTILYDPAASTTKSFTFTFTYVTLEKLEDETQGQTSEQLTQETQEADYFDFASQSHVGGGSLEFQLGQGETDSFGQQQQLESQSRQRIVKLQEELMPVTGGIVRTVSVGVELQAATKKRSYESVVTWVISKTAGEIFTKVQLSLIKNPAEGTLEEPHATCFNVQLVKPAFLPMPTLEEVLNVNFHTTIEATVFDGESCSSAPVLEVQGTLDVSDEVIRRLREEVAKDCDLADSNLLPIDVITSPLYDHAHFTAKWTEDYPVILKNLTYHIDDIIRHCLYPFTTYDHTVINPENTIDIDATKCLNCNKWTIRNERPELVSVTKGLSPPVILNEFLGPAEIRNVFFYNFVQGRTSFQCTVETTKVRTHDGVKFPYHPDNCWTTLSYFHPLSEEEAPLNAVVSARFTEEWEVRIVWKFGGYLYEFTKSQLLVNGEPCPEGGDDNVRFIVLEDASYFMLKSATLSIKVSDKIEVLYPYMARGSVDGLCGRMDGERTGDLVGPQGCIYTDPKLFALAWTTKGDGCAQFSLRAKKRAVENFQEVCPRESHVPTGVSHPNVIYDCTAWQYIERFYGDYKCRTIDATPVCKDTCKATRSVTLPLAYDCQVFGHRKNTTHQECHPHSIITTFPASCVP